MGAYLFFKLEDKERADEVDAYLFGESAPEAQKKLIEMDSQAIFINSPSEVELLKKEGDLWWKYTIERIGKGEIKTSGLSEDIEEIHALWTEVFIDLNEKFGLLYNAHSCAFTEEECYFSLEQMNLITENGTRLTNRSNEKYKMLYPLLSKDAA